ncbi:hypothetical protein KKG19_05725, partial [Patescibacteria group bacterium]|nr:hypothetical protein [Patescibacteria group bacterium]
MADSFFYKIFGLKIRSEIEFPELQKSSGKHDVSIYVGSTPDRIENPERTGARFTASPGRFLLKIDGIAKYFVREGNLIVVEPGPG